MIEQIFVLSFIDFAQSLGVYIERQQLQSDGRIHRANVGDGPSGKGDAAYLLRGDGSGWVLNFKSDGKPSYYRPGSAARKLTSDEKARISAERTAWKQQQTLKHQEAVLDALARWNESREVVNFPYLEIPKLRPAGFRQGRVQLLIPMLALDKQSGASWVGMQRIEWAEPGQSPKKRFVTGTPTKGAFSVIPIVGKDEEAPLRAFEAITTVPRVVLCEGVGTGLAIHQATGLPVIVAMSAQNLTEVAEALKSRLQGSIVICADNDGERDPFEGQSYKGQYYALKAARVFSGATGIALPIKPHGVTPSGYDARDLLRDTGPDSVLEIISHPMSQEQLEKLISPHLIPVTLITQETFMEKSPLDPVQSPSIFDSVNKALEESEAKPPRAENSERRLLQEWHQSTDFLWELSNQAHIDLDVRHRQEREDLLKSQDKIRDEKSTELEGLSHEFKNSLITFEIAKRFEELQKHQDKERRGIQSVPTFLEFLEQRAQADTEAAKLLQIERKKALTTITGQRKEPVEPAAVLEGLTHEIEDGPDGKAVHYARNGERVMSDRGERVDLIKTTDHEIKVALRLAEQKFDITKGLQLTGSHEFLVRSAEIAGRMGLKIQNQDLQVEWQRGQNPAGGYEPSRQNSESAMPVSSDQANSSGVGRKENYIDQDGIAGDCVLARLDWHRAQALRIAGSGGVLTEEQVSLLRSGKHPALIDDKFQLTELGKLSYEQLTGEKLEREQNQQQLRTRNIDQQMEDKTRKEHKTAARHEQKSRETELRR